MKPDLPNFDPRDPEARITALLLGELSPTEADETQRAIAHDPELAKLHARLAQTIPFVREAVVQPADAKPETVAGPKLSPERREALLATFKILLPEPFSEAGRAPRSRLYWLTVAAASLAIVAISAGLLLPGLARAKSKGVDVAKLSAERERVLKQQVQLEARREEENLASAAPQSSANGVSPRPMADIRMMRRGLDVMDDKARKILAGKPATAAPPRDSFAKDAAPARPLSEWFLMATNRAPAAAAPDAEALFTDLNSAGRFHYTYQESTSAGVAGSPAGTVTQGGGFGGGYFSGYRMRSVIAGQNPAGAAINPDSPKHPPAIQADAGEPVLVALDSGDVSFALPVKAPEMADQLEGTIRGAPSTLAEGRADISKTAADRLNVQAIQLGDQPTRGQMLQPSPAKPRLFAGAEFKAEQTANGRTELTPLPLKLPTPAFLGTPTDIPLDGGRRKQVANRSAGEPASQVPELAFYDNAAQPRTELAEEIRGRTVAGRQVESERRPAREIDAMRRLQVQADAGQVLVADEAAKEKSEAKVAVLAKSLEVVNAAAVPALQAVEDAPPSARPALPPPVPQPEVATAENAFSTFSLNVTDVSFRLAAAALEQGQLPEAAGIRSEEFINAFDYRDPAPAPDARLAFAWERARYPFAHNRDLLRFSVQTAAQGREPGRALNLTLVLDNSGSMERADRVAIIREALRVLAGQLQPQDKVSVVSFARTARLWVDGLPGSQAAELPDRVGNLTPEGGTNLEDALKAGYEAAQRHFQPQGANRVIVLTDGAANLGNLDPAALKARVEEQRRRGIALDCFGIGWEGYNDDLLEALARNGDGRYGFINTPEEAASGFARQLAGALQVAAADVKVQVEFNPARVANWRQIGYAKHQLTKEQFRDNTVDAAEIGAAESGNGLYVVEVDPQGAGPLGVVRARYRVPATGQYLEHEWPLEYTAAAPALENAGPALRLAASAAAFSEMLAANPYADEVNSERLLNLLAGVPEAFAPDPRPKQLESMIRQAKSLGGR